MKAIFFVIALGATAYAYPEGEQTLTGRIAARRNIFGSNNDVFKNAADNLRDRVQNAADKAQDVATEVKDKLKEVADKVNDGVQKVADKVQETVDKAKESIDKAAEKTRDGIDKVADKVTQEAEKVEEEIQKQIDLIRETIKQIEARITSTLQTNCTDNKCSFCAEIGTNNKVCADAILEKDELAVTLDVTYNGKIIIIKTFDASNPPPVCVPIPYVSMLNVCFVPYNMKIGKEGFQGCMKLKLTALGKDMMVLDLHCINIGA